MQDVYDVLVRRRIATPPKRFQHFVGTGDFHATGEEFLNFAQELGDLKPHEKVLDVGSGFGRIAIPLTRYVTPAGSYDGLEIMKRAVRWCERNITPTHRTFRFHHVDIYNALYNPRGRLSPETVSFPFARETFDFIILMSVFTHMQRPSVERYLGEIKRVLRPGGRALLTLFLLDAISTAHMAAGDGLLVFAHELQGDEAMTVDATIPEAAIAYPLTSFDKMAASAGLERWLPIRFGTWSGRPDGHSVQDIVLLRRT